MFKRDTYLQYDPDFTIFNQPILYVMSILKEFKTFALRGNVVDLAVGVIIGGAFGKITSSLVSDVLMPPLGALLKGQPFSKLSLTLIQAQGENPAVTINYGMFIQSVIDFLIIAFVVFIMIKAINKLTEKKEEEPAAPSAPPEPTKEEQLLTEIRDLLKR